MSSDAAADEAGYIERREDGVAWVTINRPDARNALDAATRDGLGDYFTAVSADLNVRAVVLTGAGEKAFCTGADLRGRGKATGPARPEGAPDRAMGDAARLIRGGWQRLVTSILDCEKPVIAAVNGTAAGGGMHLALACDMVLMADTARFIEVFVRRGILPDAGGAWILPRLIGVHRAKELMFFGDDCSSADAERIGLVNRVVPAAELDKTAGEWARKLANLPTMAVSATKWLLNQSLSTDRATSLREEANLQELIQHTADAREGLTSFAERRDPDFKGW